MAEVFGTAYIEVAGDYLYALVDALKTTMASGYDPTFSYVYRKHNEVMSLNAVSVDLDEAVDSEDEGFGSSSQQVLYHLVFTIRVHTDYVDGVMDRQKNGRLLNSIINKLKANKALGSSYFIYSVTDIRAAETFEESATLGGQITVTVTKAIQHSQE